MDSGIVAIKAAAVGTRIGAAGTALGFSANRPFNCVSLPIDETPMGGGASGKIRRAGGARGHLAGSASRHSYPAGARISAEGGGRLHTPTDDPPDRAAELPTRAERRQLTVMFCDLVGSTLLASRLDPEDLLEVMGCYRSTITATVQNFGGFVGHHLGDGVIAYFGWPQADEDDAERAVRASLEVVNSVGQSSVRGERLRVRIGVASGLLVIGDMIGAGGAPELTAVGQAPNVAARLQALAEPDTIVIAEEIRLRIGALFECEDLGSFLIKGYTAPVRAWRVDRESAVRSRFEALHGLSLTPIIGRDEEIDLLLRRWRQAGQGEGCTVLVAGEPGIGKSRLIAALEERLRGESYRRLRCFCAPHHHDDALYPVVSHFEQVLGFRRRDTLGEKARKLRTTLEEIGSSREDVALLSDLLSLPAEGLQALSLSPLRRKQKTFGALIRQLERLARDRPILIVFEDAHWSDPTTLEVFDLTINRIRTLPVMLVVTFRREFDARWAGRAGVSLITLSRLHQQQSTALILQLARGAPLPDQVIDRIVAQSDGVPLFIEELTKAVLESTALLEPEAASPAPLAVPVSLQASLMARLDRLPRGKEVAQIGAVIGRQFSHGLLSTLAHMREADLRQGVEQLLASRLVFRSGSPPDATYVFKHALVRDTAYESLLRSRRRTLHEKVVEALLEREPELAKTQPGLLGHHCALAGLIEKAATYYRHAGERSAARDALAETRSQLERGLTLVGALPHSAARRTLELELQLALGRVLLTTKGSADAEAGTVFEKAVALSRGLDCIELLTRALWGYWFNQAHRRELTVAEKAAQELLSLGQRQRNTPAQIVAHTMFGVTHFWRGRFQAACLNLKAANELCRSGEHGRVDLAIVSNHLDIHVSMQLSLALCCLGCFDAAADQGRLALQSARGLAHLPSQAIILAVACRHAWFVRDDERLRQTATTLVKLTEEQGFPFYLALGQCHLGWLEVKEGRIKQGLNRLRTGLDGLQSTDALVWAPYTLSMMAEAQAWAGHCDEAERLLDEALEHSARTGGVWFDTELFRLKGQVLLMRPSPDPQSAERFFRRAISVAQNQSAKLWQLRATISLARLWSGQGKRTEARALLGPVHAAFAEGRNTPDMKDAAALMAELAGAHSSL